MLLKDFKFKISPKFEKWSYGISYTIKYRSQMYDGNIHEYNNIKCTDVNGMDS